MLTSPLGAAQPSNRSARPTTPPRTHTLSQNGYGLHSRTHASHTVHQFEPREKRGASIAPRTFRTGSDDVGRLRCFAIAPCDQERERLVELEEAKSEKAATAAALPDHHRPAPVENDGEVASARGRPQPGKPSQIQHLPGEPGKRGEGRPRRGHPASHMARPGSGHTRAAQKVRLSACASCICSSN